MKKICIVTTRHISYNPRVLKEADALQANGYDVAVVTVNNHALQRRFDEELMQSRQWRLKTVNYRKDVGSEKPRWLYLALKNKFFSCLSRISFTSGIAERTVERAFDHLFRLARKEKADLYIVHHPEALGIGYKAAIANGAKLGFDAEDFHTGMNEASDGGIVFFLEKKYLPHCTYLTAASAGIGEAYAKKFGITRPVTILNTFPRENLVVQKVDSPVRFYWYSQVIGPNRGLELLMEAAGLVDGPFEIHLRGQLYSNAYRDELIRLAEKGRIGERLFFHEPILARDLISSGNRFDIGLALESDNSTNANICVSNKLFSYLMSGLAIIATDTYGQKDIFSYFPAAGRLCHLHDPAHLAGAMQFYLDHPQELWRAKMAALDAANTRFNWEDESKTLLNNLRLCLS